MNKDLPVIIFGNNKFASLAAYYLAKDTRRRVAGFTVDRAYLCNSHHEGLPVVPFEELESFYPPKDYELLISVGFSAINRIRRERFIQSKKRGYRFANYISSRASIWPDLQIGENCMIFEHSIVQPFVSIGDNVIIRCGASIGHHNTIASHSFIASQANLGGNINLGEQVFIGLGAVLKDGITIAPRTLVGAGSVLISNTESDKVYVGNPARYLINSSSSEAS